MDHVDPFDHVAPSDVFFLRRCDVERTLQAPLSRLYALQQARRQAATLLSAAFARRTVGRTLAACQRARMRETTIEELRGQEMYRKVAPARPFSGWLPGGPFLCVMSVRGQWILRAGMTYTSAELFQRIINHGQTAPLLVGPA